MKICEKCGYQNKDNSIFCLRCGHMIGFDRNNKPKSSFNTTTNGGAGGIMNQPPFQSPKVEGFTISVIDKLNVFIGNTSTAPLQWTDLFTDVFKKHGFQEAEDIFIYGTRRTTPPLYAISSGWPKPWLYSRVLLIFVITFILLKICVDFFGNLNAIPGLMVIGSMAIPLAMVVLFIELNIFRNVSFYTVCLIFLIGGGAAILATLFLYSLLLPEASEFGYIEALIVGFIEETGKFIIIYFFLSKLNNCKYILNGLLVGSVVGAGFAALESAGYAFTYLLNSEDVYTMYSVIYLRGFLAPGNHIAWSAIVGAAIILCGNSFQRKITLDYILSQGKFWKIFLLAVTLHFLWDSPFLEGFGIIKNLILVVGAWVVTLIMVQMGLQEADKVVQRNF